MVRRMPQSAETNSVRGETVIYVFSFDQGAVSAVLRSPALQKLGLWSYSRSTPSCSRS